MFFVWSQKRINVKLAWWGGVDSGKTTSIHTLAADIARDEDAPEDGDSRPRAVGMRRNAQPVEINEPNLRMTTYFCHPGGEIDQFSGYPVHYQCKTAEQPGPDNRANQKVLDGISGVIFVADARRRRQPANEAALRTLADAMGQRKPIDAATTPERVDQLFGPHGPLRLVVQVNRMDADDAVSGSEVRRGLMLPDWVPTVETVATEGVGVYEAFETMGRELRPLLQAAQRRGRIP